MMYMLNALMGKKKCRKPTTHKKRCKQRDVNSKKDTEGKVRNQNTVPKIKKAFVDYQ